MNLVERSVDAKANVLFPRSPLIPVNLRETMTRTMAKKITNRSKLPEV